MAHHMMSPMAMDGSDDEDEDSVHSAISNLSDFDGEDEQVEYFAMELVNHLPPEEAAKLLKNMRAKEKAVQDLLHRNRSLLDSCQRLDEENQALTDKVAEMESAPAEPAAAASAPNAAGVDTSFFQKMEAGKEEKILRLQKENHQLSLQVRRLDDCSRRSEEALAQARKEIKKLSQGRSVAAARPPAADSAASTAKGPSGLMDEEERIYRELQDGKAQETTLAVDRRRQEEQRARIKDALQALLKEDATRIERWGSDVKALLLAVDGLEAHAKPSAKHAAKKGKAAAPPAGASAAAVEQLQEAASQLMADFDALRAKVESAEKAQLSMEQTLRGTHDGAAANATAIVYDCSASAADDEAERLRVQLEQANIHVEPVAATLKQVEASLGKLVTGFPPGLLPPAAVTALTESQQQVEEVVEQISHIEQYFSEFKEKSLQGVQGIQAKQHQHGIQLRQRVADEFERSTKALEQPLARIRAGLRQQSEALGQARESVDGLDSSVAAARRGLASGSAAADAAATAGGEAGASDAMASGLKEVRSMGRALAAGLDEGAKALEGRLALACKSILGDDDNGAGGGASAGRRNSSGAAGKSAALPGGSSAEASAAEGKKKRGKKNKGKAENAAARSAEGRPDAAQDAAASGGSEGASEAAPPARSGAPPQAAASESGGQAVTKLRSGDGSGRHVLTGPELLQELQSLNDETKALEARMAERMKANSMSEGDGEARQEDAGEAGSVPRPAPKARRKKMFV